MEQNTPVIDVHAHVFSAQDIPLDGYLRAREPVRGFDRFLFDILQQLNLKPSVVGLVANMIREKQLDSKALVPTLLKATISLLLGKQYLKWARTISGQVKDIAAEMERAYPGIHLYVPLMIDYEYWFESTIDTPLADQIQTLYENVIVPSRGRIHPFVAFDPARELAFRKHMLNPDGRPERLGSLALVKQAIEEMGFIGVKLYNSVGYRPFHNAVVDDQRKSRIKLHQQMGYHVFKGEDYDQVLSELYDYCVEQQVPITTHCGMEGIEIYRDASFDFGKAALWHEVLSQSRYRDLCLNLAHFGWHQRKWTRRSRQGYHGHRSWVKDICHMLLDYPYLYTDVSHHPVVLERERQRFKLDYQDMRRDWDTLDDTGRNGWSEIKKKLLFGIDWHVIKRVKKYGTFQERYEEVLRDSGFSKDEITAFLGGNALDFLGLRPGGKNRERLVRFYKKEGIHPPEWFNLTSGSQAPGPASVSKNAP